MNLLMTFGEPTTDRRAARHEATKAEIVEAAWALAREHGLAGVSLRDLAKRVGMQPPSLYSYFPSKHAIYDAMFAQGYEALLDLRRRTQVPDDPREAVRVMAHQFLAFCVEDPARYQLLFQRTIPGFEPSEESYALATEVLGVTSTYLDRAGAGDAESRDLWTALLTGLADQQISNDPGGDRWVRLVDTAVDMFLDSRGQTRRRRR